ncbi:MAG: hypothetical protein HY298_14675 [Verrucomicrobia bacterium]|nr:hypothetical protein [Verrucomicrobiota bacterium]
MKENVTQFGCSQLCLPWGVVGVLWWCWAAPVVSGQSTNLVLTTAAEVLALPAERAQQGIPVVVNGVVTAAEKYWNGKFFIQDASGGVFVDNVSPRQPLPGELVEVSGISHPGAFAPCIGQPRWRRLGTAPLPEARRVSIERLMSGVEDGQRIEITGIVRAVEVENGLRAVDLMSGGFRLRVFAKIPPGPGDLQKLVASRVRVRGTAAVSFNAQLRQMTTMKVFAPLLEDFMVEETESSTPFKEPTVPLNSIAQYRKDHDPGKRVHVTGVVTLQRLGEDFFLQDSTGGLHVRSRQVERLTVGERVEAVGFPDFEHFLPVLQDAVFHKSSDSQIPVQPRTVSAEELQAGLHHAALITFQGKLLDRVTTWRSDRAGEGTHLQTVLMLQRSNLLFSAESETSSKEPTLLTELPPGSTVEVTGVCMSEIEPDGKLRSLQVLLPSEKNVRVLERPSWWTPRRLVIGLAMLIVVLLFAVAWTVVISRKNSALRVMVGEKELAQIELQHANDRLEERVKERTEQLKLQITARQEAELQFKAVLRERTRLAQELHDTLEQTLTGIALQMDTAAKFAVSDGARANHHLELARNLVTQSQAEVRCSVWDLRSRSPEHIDLPGLLLKISQQLTDDTSLQAAVTSTGRVRPLPEIIEENLLRVAQEGLTNIIKHSKATQATMALDYGPRNVILDITDNGAGFTVGQQAGPREGHFGLLGITERINRLRGKVAITSTPGVGTTIQVSIPIDQPPDAELVRNQVLTHP